MKNSIKPYFLSYKRRRNKISIQFLLSPFYGLNSVPVKNPDLRGACLHGGLLLGFFEIILILKRPSYSSLNLNKHPVDTRKVH